MSGGLDPREDAQQRRLACAVEPEDHHPRATVHREVDPGEHLERAVALRQPGRGERGPPARLRGREADRGDPVGHPLLVEALEQRGGPALHLLGRHGLRRLGAHLRGLGLQRRRLLLGVGALAAPPCLVVGAGAQVVLPRHVVGVELAAGRVEEPHLVDDVREQVGVVADDHHPALVAPEEAAQPGDRVGVEVVGRLVEQQRGAGVAPVPGGGEEDPGELDAAPLPTGEGLQRLGEHAVGQAEVGADPPGLALGGVPAEVGEPRLEAAVARDGLVALGVVGQLGHRRLGLLHVAQDLVEPPRGEHAVLGEHRQVALARVLREVADRAGRADGAAVRLGLPGEGAQRGRLARAVASDEADAVPRLHAQGDPREQDAGAGAQLEIGRGDHRGPHPGSWSHRSGATGSAVVAGAARPATGPSYGDGPRPCRATTGCPVLQCR